MHQETLKGCYQGTDFYNKVLHEVAKKFYNKTA